MKNATRYCAGPAFITEAVAQQTFTVQNKPAAVATKGNHHPSFFRFGIGVKKTVERSQNCGGAENVVKTETQQNVNGLLGFITLGIYIPLEAAMCIAHTIA